MHPGLICASGDTTYRELPSKSGHLIVRACNGVERMFSKSDIIICLFEDVSLIVYLPRFVSMLLQNMMMMVVVVVVIMMMMMMMMAGQRFEFSAVHLVNSFT